MIGSSGVAQASYTPVSLPVSVIYFDHTRSIVSNFGENTSSGLEQKLKDKTAVVGIVGLGYVGLPLAVAFSQTGFNILGKDGAAGTRQRRKWPE